MSVLPGFTDHSAEVNGQTIAYSRAGDGPPVLLLHGFPQTRAMWRGVAPALAARFTVIAADLRGYGASSKPEGVAAYTFRQMAADQRRLMQALGFEAFHLVENAFDALVDGEIVRRVVAGCDRRVGFLAGLGGDRQYGAECAPESNNADDQPAHGFPQAARCPAGIEQMACGLVHPSAAVNAR